MQTDAFLSAAEALGRRTTVLYEPNPGLRGQRLSWRRVEAWRQSSAARRHADAVRDARSLWVVAAAAQHGGGAPLSGRPYACWIGTTIGSESRGRGPALPRMRRAAAAVSIRRLRAIERQVLGGASALYATSPASRQEIALAAGVEEREVGVLPIPVDCRHFTPEPDDLWLSRLDAPVIAFVGRADDPRKNVALLLQAFHLVRRELPAARLRLIGAPPNEPAAAGVEIAGVVEEIAPLLRESTLLVLPSFQEGFGIVVAEALACGVPAVVTPSGGPEAIVRASGAGRVMTSWSERELADTLIELLGSPALLADMRNRGRAYVQEKHSPTRFHKLLGQALERLDG